MKNQFIVFTIVLLIIGFNAVIGQSLDTISIENVNVIPMTEELILKNQRVIVANGKIFKIEPSSTPLHHEVNLTINGTGKYIIPGLSEMHYHWRSNDIENDFKLLIANGITTVRNMAEREGQNNIAIREKMVAGELLAPNYFTTGPYLRFEDLQTEDQVLEVVKAHKEKGYDFLKIADNLPRNIYLRLLEECQRSGLPIIGHAQRNLPLEYSLRMKSIEHVEEFIYLGEGKNGNTLFKQTLPELERVSGQIKSSEIYIGTTLVVFDFINQYLDDNKFASLQNHPLVKYLAKEEREGWLSEKNDYRKLKNLEFDGVKAPILFNEYFSWIKKFTCILSDNGAHFLNGSDTYGMVVIGFSLHQEFQLLQEAGIKPYNILMASTVNSARYLNTYSLKGTITEGKNANLVMLNKNPLVDIKNTKSIEGVMLKGKWFDRDQLDMMLEEVESAYK